MPLLMSSLMRRLNVTSCCLSSKSSISRLFVLLIIVSAIVDTLATSQYYSTSDSDLTSDLVDDYNANIAKLLFVNRKRSCVRRGASCDHRPEDCCDSSVCRCNMWGANCRCQRAGLFKWG
ncbi:U8-agatoxin-Ao1a-like isoform X2 [Oppia nitens]|uniref:U8-agatoxin-Ao1a-like isoform X2 n=1 Tax=Oppia nitens TaxID=1686743 RepID=UPI0023DB1AA1|nr:U8-agatoxin-Ao1a-like isoform X2 [Oppia nitens]